MKKIILNIILISLLTNCTKKAGNDFIMKKIEDKQIAKENIDDLPSWILASEDLNGIAGIGIASKSKGGIKFQIKRAKIDARANIANKIESSISRVTKEALQEANVNNMNDVTQFFSQATKEVVKERSLSGVTVTNMFKDKDGNLYIRMILDNKDYFKYLENSKRIYQERLRSSNIAKDNINNSKKAVDDLFNELEEERRQELY